MTQERPVLLRDLFKVIVKARAKIADLEKQLEEARDPSTADAGKMAAYDKKMDAADSKATRDEWDRANYERLMG